MANAKDLTTKKKTSVTRGAGTWLEKRLVAHNAVAKVLSKATTLSEATPEIIREISKALGWELGMLWRVDSDAQAMVCEASWCTPALNAEKFTEKIRGTVLPFSKGLPGRVWATGEAAWVDNYIDEDLPSTPITATERIHGAACVPIKLREQVLGALEFVSRDIGQPDPKIQEMMTVIGTQIGLFIERNRCHDMLKNCEERYRVLADVESDVLITIDDELNIMFANKASEQIFGFMPAELLNKKLTSLIPEFTMQHSTVSDQPVCRTLSGVQKNGEKISVDVTFSEFIGKGKKYATGTIRDISERLRTQNVLREYEQKLQSVLASGPGGQIIADAPAMVELFARVKKAAASYAGILIQGETGSGKECVALSLHNQSPRSGKAFVARNCAAIPANLFESEMFGHKKGSFTGADKDRKGAFLEADGGTLFLDEIGDLEYSLQTKLLRAIQEKVVRPVGSDKDIPVDPRIICATNKDLKERCKTQEFREDLYYRLVTVVLIVPPLRERQEDIIPLARHFVGIASKWVHTLTSEAEKRLLSYSWPGNVRELRNMMEQAVIFAAGNEIRPDELNFLSGPIVKSKESSALLVDAERRHILEVMKKFNGNKTDAAIALGVARSTLVLKLKGYAGESSSKPDLSGQL